MNFSFKVAYVNLAHKATNPIIHIVTHCCVLSINSTLTSMITLQHKVNIHYQSPTYVISNTGQLEVIFSIITITIITM